MPGSTVAEVGVILVDSRTGSKELIETIRRAGGKAQLDTLEFGDFAFEGNGPNGSVLVGVERKAVRDMLNSIRYGRYSDHQLPGMLKLYGYSYLIVEGVYRPGGDGMLEGLMRGGFQPIYLGSQGFLYRELDMFLTTISMMTPVRIRRSEGTGETAHQVVNLEKWWAKPWDSHHAHQQLQSMPPGGAVLYEPSLLRRIAKELPGIGWGKSKDVEEFFGTVEVMVNATQAEWKRVDGVGKTLSERIWQALRLRGSR